MASKPPVLLKTDAPAGGPVQPCPYATIGAAKPPLSPEMRARLVPRDLLSVTLRLASHTGGGTVTGSAKKASAKDVAGLDPEINKLLQSHAVVIVQVVPATTVAVAGMDPGQARNRDLAKTKGSAKADASFSAAMKAQCGEHPDFRRSPEIAKDEKNKDPKVKALVADTEEWTPVSFVKAIFGGKKFRDFIFGQKDEVTFTARSCAFPASGDPTGSLTGYAQLALADTWEAEFNWFEGFKLEFGASSMHGKDYGDGSRMNSQSKSVKSSAKSLESSSSVSTVTRNDELLYGKVESKRGASSAEITYDGGPMSGSMEADMKRWNSTELPKNVADSFKEKGDKLKDLSKDGTLSIKLIRNGKSLVDTNKASALLKEVQETLETGLDLISKLVWLLENGAKAGIPVTITFGLKASLQLLVAQTYARFWAEQTAPTRSGSYYVAGYKRRFQLGVDITVVTMSFTPSITLQAKLVHEWVASLTLTVEGKISGSAKVGYSLTDGTGAADFNAVGKIGMSVKGSGEAAAVSCYVVVEGTASSGITYTLTAGFDGEAMKDQTNEVRSDQLTFQATARYGNKIWDFIGLGSEEPDWQWPADGPFVWLKQNAISKSW